MKKARDEARAKGLSPKTRRQLSRPRSASSRRSRGWAGRCAGGCPAEAGRRPRCRRSRWRRQKAAAHHEGARGGPRARACLTEEERKSTSPRSTQGVLRRAGGRAPAAAPALRLPAAAAAPMDRAMRRSSSLRRRQALITKAREEARAKGMSPEDEKKYVAEALKAFSAEKGQ